MMKKIFIILLLFIPYIANSQTKWYIDPAGSDTHGKGTAGDPWLTLHHATDTVTGPNFSDDTIFVNAGDYIESNRIDLGVGVNIKGEGYTSHIISTYEATSSNLDGSILLTSTSENTSGDQSISYIRLDGSSLTGHVGICIHNRGNVKVHHCTIVDFQYNGISQTNYASSAVTPPTTHATGIEIYNDTINNCSGGNSGNFFTGLLRFSGCDSMLIHNNVFDQSDRATGNNGNNLASRFTKQLRFYDNKSIRAEVEVPTTASVWDFHWEAFDSEGGCQINNNTFTGTSQQLDINSYGYNSKGTYDYAWWIHDNTFQLASKLTHSGSNYLSIGIDIETVGTDMGYVKINNNYFKNIPIPIAILAQQGVNGYTHNINIFYNLIEDCGYANEAFDFGIELLTDVATNKIEYVYIDNNTIAGSSGTGRPWVGILLGGAGPFDEIYIRNNILNGFYYGPYWNWGSTITNLYTLNNLLYLTGNSDDIDNDGTITNYVNTNNIKSDPLFVGSGDYSLQAGSPAINTGTNVNLTRDYLHNVVGFVPCIGAYEYLANPPAPQGTHFLKHNGKFVKHNGKFIR